MTPGNIVVLSDKLGRKPRLQARVLSMRDGKVTRVRINEAIAGLREELEISEFSRWSVGNVIG